MKKLSAKIHDANMTKIVCKCRIFRLQHSGVSASLVHQGRYLPIRNRGMERKKPPMAQTLVTAAFFKYLLLLKHGSYTNQETC